MWTHLLFGSQVLLIMKKFIPIFLLILILLGCSENDEEVRKCIVEDFLQQNNVCTLENDESSLIGFLSDFLCDIDESCLSANCPDGGFPINGNAGLISPINFDILNASPNLEDVTINAEIPSDNQPLFGQCRPFFEETCTEEQFLSNLGICVDIPDDCFFEDEFDPECPAPDIASSCQLDGIEFNPRGFGCSFTNGDIIESGTLSAGNCEALDCFNLSCTIGMNISGVFTQVPIELEITDPNPDPDIGLFEFDAVFDGETGFTGSCGGIVF